MQNKIFAFSNNRVFLNALCIVNMLKSHQTMYFQVIMSTHWGVDILFLLFPPSAVRRSTWFPDILGNSSYPIFTKFGMQVYWVNSLYGIAFGDDSSIAN